MTHPSTELQKMNNTWSSYIEAGNGHFRDGDYLAAQDLYEQALTLGRQLLQAAVQQTHAPETIHLYIVSCFNMANVHQQLEQRTEAERMLRQAYDTALALMTCQTLSLNFRATVYQGFSAAFGKLIEFYGQRGDSLSSDALVSHAQPLVLELLREVSGSLKAK